jgi:membrane-associated phospholipid phosphatase
MRPASGRAGSARWPRAALWLGAVAWALAGSGRPADALYTRTQLRADLAAACTCRHLGAVAAGLAAAGLVHPWDGPVQERLAGYGDGGPVLRGANLVGSSLFVLPVGLGLWAAGAASGRGELRAASGDALRALALAQTVVAPLKRVSRRQRPDRSNRLSFPSGHAANAAAVAGVLTRRFGWRAGVPACLVVPVVGVARLAGRHHYLSDVVAGAALGSVAGYALPPGRMGERVAWAPAPGAEGWGLRLAVSL